LKSMRASAPAVLTIDLAAVGTASATQLRALPGLGVEALWLELSPGTLEYLHAAAAHQAAVPKEAEKKSEAASSGEQSPTPGVYWLTSKKTWRAQYTDPESKKQRYKFFSAEDANDAASKAAAGQRAKDFLEGVKKKTDAEEQHE